MSWRAFITTAPLTVDKSSAAGLSNLGSDQTETAVPTLSIVKSNTHTIQHEALLHHLKSQYNESLQELANFRGDLSASLAIENLLKVRKELQDVLHSIQKSQKGGSSISEWQDMLFLTQKNIIHSLHTNESLLLAANMSVRDLYRLSLDNLELMEELGKQETSSICATIELALKVNDYWSYKTILFHYQSSFSSLYKNYLLRSKIVLEKLPLCESISLVNSMPCEENCSPSIAAETLFKSNLTFEECIEFFQSILLCISQSESDGSLNKNLLLSIHATVRKCSFVRRQENTDCTSQALNSSKKSSKKVVSLNESKQTSDAKAAESEQANTSRPQSQADGERRSARQRNLPAASSDNVENESKQEDESITLFQAIFKKLVATNPTAYDFYEEDTLRQKYQERLKVFQDVQPAETVSIVEEVEISSTGAGQLNFAEFISLCGDLVKMVLNVAEFEDISQLIEFERKLISLCGEFMSAISSYPGLIQIDAIQKLRIDLLDYSVVRCSLDLFQWSNFCYRGKWIEDLNEWSNILLAESLLNILRKANSNQPFKTELLVSSLESLMQSWVDPNNTSKQIVIQARRIWVVLYWSLSVASTCENVDLSEIITEEMQGYVRVLNSISETIPVIRVPHLIDGAQSIDKTTLTAFLTRLDRVANRFITTQPGGFSNSQIEGIIDSFDANFMQKALFSRQSCMEDIENIGILRVLASVEQSRTWEYWKNAITAVFKAIAGLPLDDFVDSLLICFNKFINILIQRFSFVNNMDMDARYLSELMKTLQFIYAKLLIKDTRASDGKETITQFTSIITLLVRKSVASCMEDIRAFLDSLNCFWFFNANSISASKIAGEQSNAVLEDTSSGPGNRYQKEVRLNWLNNYLDTIIPLFIEFEEIRSQMSAVEKIAWIGVTLDKLLKDQNIMKAQVIDIHKLIIMLGFCFEGVDLDVSDKIDAFAMCRDKLLELGETTKLKYFFKALTPLISNLFISTLIGRQGCTASSSNNNSPAVLSIPRTREFSFLLGQGYYYLFGFPLISSLMSLDGIEEEGNDVFEIPSSSMCIDIYMFWRHASQSKVYTKNDLRESLMWLHEQPSMSSLLYRNGIYRSFIQRFLNVPAHIAYTHSHESLPENIISLRAELENVLSSSTCPDNSINSDKDHLFIMQSNIHNDLLELGLPVMSVFSKDESFAFLIEQFPYLVAVSSDAAMDRKAMTAVKFLVDDLAFNITRVSSWEALFRRMNTALNCLNDELHGNILYIDNCDFFREKACLYLNASRSESTTEPFISGVDTLWKLDPSTWENDLIPFVDGLFEFIEKNYASDLEKWYKTSLAESIFMQRLIPPKTPAAYYSFQDNSHFIKAMITLDYLKRYFEVFLHKIYAFTTVSKIEERPYKISELYGIFSILKAGDFPRNSVQRKAIQDAAKSALTTGDYLIGHVFAVISSAKYLWQGRKALPDQEKDALFIEVLGHTRRAMSILDDEGPRIGKASRINVLYQIFSLRFKVALSVLRDPLSTALVAEEDNLLKEMETLSSYSSPSSVNSTDSEEVCHVSKSRFAAAWSLLLHSFQGLLDCRKKDPFHFRTHYRISDIIYQVSEQKLLSSIPIWATEAFEALGVSGISKERSLLELHKLFEKKKPQIVAMWSVENPVSPWDQITARISEFDSLRRKYTDRYLELIQRCNDLEMLCGLAQNAAETKTSSATVHYILASSLRLLPIVIRSKLSAAEAEVSPTFIDANGPIASAAIIAGTGSEEEDCQQLSKTKANAAETSSSDWRRTALDSIFQLTQSLTRRNVPSLVQFLEEAIRLLLEVLCPPPLIATVVAESIESADINTSISSSMAVSSESSDENSSDSADGCPLNTNTCQYYEPNLSWKQVLTICQSMLVPAKPVVPKRSRSQQQQQSGLDAKVPRTSNSQESDTSIEDEDFHSNNSDIVMI